MLIVGCLERLECARLGGAGNMRGRINRLDDIRLLEPGMMDVRVVNLGLMKRAGVQVFVA